MDLALIRFVRQLVTDHRVDDQTFDALVAHLGIRGVTDIIGPAGYHDDRMRDERVRGSGPARADRRTSS